MAPRRKIFKKPTNGVGHVNEQGKIEPTLYSELLEAIFR